MSSLVIFFTVVISVILSQNEANAKKIPEIEIDLGKLLNLVQQQRNRNSRIDNSFSSSSSESDSSGEEASSRTSKSENEELLYGLLKEAFKYDPNVIADDRDRNSYRDRSSKVKRYNTKSGYEYIVDQILNGFPNSKLPNSAASKSYYHSRSKSPKKRLTPNRLLWDDSNKKADNLDDYSQVYIMLTPKAVQKTKARSTINDLVSKILSLSSGANRANHRAPSKQIRYKGFAIRNQAGRRRGSREMYAPNDSAEDKPKRGRGGGGGGGHTAIPYIRHRGENIYEKDN